MITVKNYETLLKLPSTPTEGDYAVCTDEKTAYVYKDEKWNKIEGKDAKLNVNLYELNKTVYKSMPEITFNELQEKKKEIAEWLKTANNMYYMLLCRERGDYTVFHYSGGVWLSPLEDEVTGIICSRGKLKAIEFNAVERWIQFWVEFGGEVYMYAFFPYDVGVIECR